MSVVRFVLLFLFVVLARFLRLRRVELMRTNTSPFSRVFDRYVAALSRTPRFAAFADECRRIQLIETNDGGALTTSNFGVIQMCTKHVRRERNEIVYVLVHELTHVYLKSELHNERFDRAFSELLEIAVKDGLYAPRKYTKTAPGVFCDKEFY